MCVPKNLENAPRFWPSYATDKCRIELINRETTKTRKEKGAPVGDLEKRKNYIDRYFTDMNQTLCMKIDLAILYGKLSSDIPSTTLRERERRRLVY